MRLTPSIYEHAARIIGRRPWDVSRDPDLLFRAHAEAYRLYRHSPVVVGIDIYNLEAEAYGAAIAEPGGNGIPAITESLCGSLPELRALAAFDPRRDGRVPRVIEVGRRLQRAFPEADVRIPLSGPFSIAGNLLGLDRLLCEALCDPAGTREALRHLVDGQVRFCAAVVEAGLDIAFFESAAAPPLLSPAQFHEVEWEPLRETLARTARLVGHGVPCIVGGDTTPILDDLLATGTSYLICPAETDQQAFMDAVRSRTDVTVRVNARPAVLAGGSWPEIRAELDRILAVIAGRENTCAGTGALPYEAAPGNVLRAIEYLETV